MIARVRDKMMYDIVINMEIVKHSKHKWDGA